jgi:demethylmenaquinone methyltransferase/2-methoxy-6-polyprenyl-1,4-benzoquinol methylase
MPEIVVPDKSSAMGKKDQVRRMFDDIAVRYDFLNRFLSMGTDRQWRRKAVKALEPFRPTRIIDVATGTGDLAIEAMTLNPNEIIGVDISEGMLAIGREKLKTLGLNKIILVPGDSENLRFDNGSFDAAMVAFGVRNFENMEAGLREMSRVLKKDSPLVILEFSKPTLFPVKQLFQFYSRWILPITGKFVSKNETAYKYLPESVRHFPEGRQFEEILSKCGYHKISSNRLSFGICTLYIAQSLK